MLFKEAGAYMKKPVLSCPIAVIPTLDSKKSMVYHDGRQTPLKEDFYG